VPTNAKGWMRDMATAILTLTDEPDGHVRIRVQAEPKLPQGAQVIMGTPAQVMALKMLDLVRSEMEGDANGD